MDLSNIPPAAENAEARYIKRLLTTVSLLLALGLLVAGVWLSIQVWLAVFAGILLAVFLRMLSTKVCGRTHLPRVCALVTVLLALLGLLALGGWLAGPKALDQFSQLADRLPKAVERLKQHAAEQGWNRFLPQQLPTGNDVANAAGKVAANAATFFKVSVGAITNLFLIMFLGIYLAAAPEVYVNGLLRLFPVGHRRRAREVLDKVGDNLGHWLLGQLVSMLVVGTLIATGLSVLGIPLGLALGVLAGLFNFIPIVGSLLSAVPAVLLAFLVSPWHPLYVVGVYVLVNTVIEGHVLVPLIQRYAVNLPPAVALVALIVMGKLFGFLGLLLAIPMATTALVLVQSIYVEGVLGDKGSMPPAARLPVHRKG
jgi:predicted PurR-regulated permease PerM